jgi:ATP-dependent DNA ligase
MDLPVMPPVKPMLAKPAATIPAGMQYEAKWDGFRAIIHRDGPELVIGSRSGKPLTRYFPELVEELLRQLPPRCVLDGEIIVITGGTAGTGSTDGDRLDFDALQERIHPADSRVRLLDEHTPASLVVFDLLADGDTALLDTPLRERRAALVRLLAGVRPPLYVAPATLDRELAEQWFRVYEGAGLDGVMAKSPDLPYRPDQRLMVKVKHERTADCVVAGYREHKSGPVVGSLLLGLYDRAGQLQHVGVCASFPMRRRGELVEELAPLRMPSAAGHPWADWANEEAHATARMPGGPSRWSGSKDLAWVPLRPELVCEVGYDHMQGDRFRHTTRFRRWRPDREPVSCDYAQLDEPVRYRLSDVLPG